MGTRYQVLGKRGDLGERASLGGEPGAGEGDHPLTEGAVAAVDDVHREQSGHLVGGQFGALDGGRERAAERDHHDALGTLGGDLTEHLLELSGRRCRGGGQFGRGGAHRPELGGGELRAVDVIDAADADGERHDVDAPGSSHVGGEVAGRVGDDADGG